MHSKCIALESSWNTPPLPGPWKDYLAWNWSLVPKRLGTIGLKCGLFLFVVVLILCMQLLLHYTLLCYIVENFPLKWWSDTQSKYHIVESEFQRSFSLCFFFSFGGGGGGGGGWWGREGAGRGVGVGGVGRWASSSVQVNSYMLSFLNISLFCHLVPFSVTLC